MKQRWYESKNDMRFREAVERQNLDPFDYADARHFIDRSGSLADSLPRWVNWLIGIVLVLYFGGGLIAPFFWKI